MHSSESQPFGASDADRVASVLELVFRLTRRVSPQGEFSLTSYLVLSRLNRHGAARVTELADHEGVTQPAMTQIVTRLRGAGLVEQVADPTDGRAVQLSITQAGQQVLADRRAERAAHVADLLKQLSRTDRAAILAAAPALENLARLAPEGPSRR